MQNTIIVLVLAYIVGYVLIYIYLTGWFKGTIKLDLGELLFKRPFQSQDDFDEQVIFRSPFLGKLVSCHFCCSFWLSLIISGILLYSLPLPWYWMLICVPTWPIIYKYTKNI